MANPTLHVRIISPQQLILETDATSVSSKNAQGKFDVLPLHANFITMIEGNPIIVRPLSPVNGQKELKFEFPFSIILNTNNTVNIYTYVSPDLEKK